jgi:hypothetical protein
MILDDVDGVTVAGIIFDAGAYSDNLMVVGETDSNNDHSANPTLLADLFFRIGGVHGGVASTDVALEINSDDVIGDHFWIWRADHGDGVGWDLNKARNGLVVNGIDLALQNARGKLGGQEGHLGARFGDRLRFFVGDLLVRFREYFFSLAPGVPDDGGGLFGSLYLTVADNSAAFFLIRLHVLLVDLLQLSCFRQLCFGVFQLIVDTRGTGRQKLLDRLEQNNPEQDKEDEDVDDVDQDI